MQYRYLSGISSPADIKKLDIRELDVLAEEMRDRILRKVTANGGHLSSNLGDVELTIALHYVFDAPNDKLVFDVGHQAYAHKLLTGRQAVFDTLRRSGGISGFPDMKESPFDSFAAGHASNAISAALGMAQARDLKGEKCNIVAIVGDGALTGGMCYEALNHAGQQHRGLIVVLNDNDMSISRNVGALSGYLTGLRRSRLYRAAKRRIRSELGRIPKVGPRVFRFIERIRDAVKALVIHGQFFEALGFDYVGPVDGHDLKNLIRTFTREKDTERPVLIHVVTQKGRGYAPAEDDPSTSHSVKGASAIAAASAGGGGTASYTSAAGKALCALADAHEDVVAITAAMEDGTGLKTFAERFPQRFFDVGIAEEHAVTMAGGLASMGMRPFVAIYSTFLSRAYDQMLIDICRNSLPVVFMVDRAGLTGEDGATHQGIFDIAFLRTMPGITVASPKDDGELEAMVSAAYDLARPFAIRYPRSGPGAAEGRKADEEAIRAGKWEILRRGKDACIYAYGRPLTAALNAAEDLASEGIECTVVNARFLKPIDEEALIGTAAGVRAAFFAEEQNTPGSLAEASAFLLSEAGIPVPCVHIGPEDSFIPHATQEEQCENASLDRRGIAGRIRAALHEYK